LNSGDWTENVAGKFIVLDGPDGCGKSTQTGLLSRRLEGKGIETSRFRDPGDTAISERIRDILLDREHISMTSRTEVLLYMAARAQLWAEQVAPALREGKCVVLDRWISSTCAYQGHAGEFGMDRVVKVATDCLERVWPDLTIILDVDLKTSATRMPEKKDRIESKPSEYHQAVREGFLKLAEECEGFAVVDATGDIDEVHAKVMENVESFFLSGESRH